MRTSFFLRVFLCAVLALPLAAEESAMHGKHVNGIAAIVNSKIITQEDVRQAVLPLQEDIARSTTNPSEQRDKLQAAALDALSKLVERELILQAFANVKGSPQIPEEWIDRQMRDIIHHQYDGDQQLFVKTLQGQGKTLPLFRQEIRARAIVQFMREREVSSNIFISPYKIEQYYQKNEDKFSIGDQLKLRMIFLKRGDESRRAAAEELARKLNDGADFAELAAKHTEDNRAGAAAWFSAKDLRPEMVQAAAKLKAGEHSGVIETDAGFWMLKLEEAKPAHRLTLAEVRNEIEQILAQRERDRLQREWIERLKRKAHIRYF